MSLLVLDASVAVKWAIPARNEDLSAEAYNLLKRHSEGEIDFLVPDIFWAEVGNVFYKGVRLGRWKRPIAERGAAAMQELDFQTVSCHVLFPEAMTIALTHDRSVYDCLYVALAIQCRTEMITADERLANALAARLPVKWLGAF